VPLHEPLFVVSVLPSTADPLITGSAVLVGALVFVTVAVAFERADDDPSLFDAVTRTRSRLPTSFEVRTYVWSVAPEISAQLLPWVSHRLHRKSNEIGAVPVQEPVVAVRVEPFTVEPLMVGSVLTSGAAAAARSDVGGGRGRALPGGRGDEQYERPRDGTSGGDRTASCEPMCGHLSLL
jgi:hypothetical protein